MANMSKQSILGARIFTFEGDLLKDEMGGVLPMTYIGLILKDAPENQVWVYKHYFLAEWMEDSYSTGEAEAQPVIDSIKEKGVVNLISDWVTDIKDCNTRG